MVNRASPSPANSNLTLPGELQPHPPRPSLSAIAEREGGGRELRLTNGSANEVLWVIVFLSEGHAPSRNVFTLSAKAERVAAKQRGEVVADCWYGGGLLHG
jgi:hypothetical protein